MIPKLAEGPKTLVSRPHFLEAERGWLFVLADEVSALCSVGWLSEKRGKAEEMLARASEVAEIVENFIVARKKASK